MHLSVVNNRTAKDDAARLEAPDDIVEGLIHREPDLNGAAAARQRFKRASRGMQTDGQALAQIDPSIFVVCGRDSHRKAAPQQSLGARSAPREREPREVLDGLAHKWIRRCVRGPQGVSARHCSSRLRSCSN